ncbi:MAG: hypothetical protein QMB38_01575 [Ascidiaceihabitans sp.]|jgi:hypothetical protein
MFNDDVQAICPVCNGRTVSYDATKIACLECKFEEAFGISSDTPSASVKALKSDQMVIVLQRWQFAG